MMNFRDLDGRIRGCMLDEIRSDYADGTLYISNRLSARGRLDWPDLLAAAAEHGSEDDLAVELRRYGRMEVQEVSHRRGKAYLKAMPSDAPVTLAEGEFNRFYVRAICMAAIDDGQADVGVYRAKEVRQPRRASLMLDGTTLDAASLLIDLRNHQGVDTALGLPPGPNSGMSAHLLRGSGHLG